MGGKESVKGLPRGLRASSPRSVSSLASYLGRADRRQHRRASAAGPAGRTRPASDTTAGDTATEAGFEGDLVGTFAITPGDCADAGVTAGSSFRMPDEVLDRYVKHLIAAHRSDTVTFAWQEGEPTLAGLDLLRRAGAQRPGRGARTSEPPRRAWNIVAVEILLRLQIIGASTAPQGPWPNSTGPR